MLSLGNRLYPAKSDSFDDNLVHVCCTSSGMQEVYPISMLRPYKRLCQIDLHYERV